MVGTNINRNITWAEQAKPLMTYFARISYLLQQGTFVADIAYLLPEGAPSTMPFWGAGLEPAPPAGYDYDYINTDVLLHRISVEKDGSLRLPDGMSYRVLVLPPTTLMTPEVLRKIHELVAAGATIVGERPANSPSLMGYPEADSEVHDLAADVWGDMDGVTNTQHIFGKGSMFWGLPLRDILAKLEIYKDFDTSHPLNADLASIARRDAENPSNPLPAALVTIHRRTADADFYFVANQTDTALEVNARFRVTGKAAEIWHPDTGNIAPAGYSIADGLTTIPLHLAERESIFVVFRKLSLAPSRMVSNPVYKTLGTISGPWDIVFQPNLGAPAKVQLPKLESWTEDSREGVKYFSGTATYTKTLQVPPAWIHPGAEVVLDLGTVKDIAEVSLNGKFLGELWKPPYQVNITDALKPGANQLEIKVTNEWTNRIIGDRLLPPDHTILAPVGNPMGGPAAPARPRVGAPAGPRRGFSQVPDTPVESGLIGPVAVLSVVGK